MQIAVVANGLKQTIAQRFFAPLPQGLPTSPKSAAYMWPTFILKLLQVWIIASLARRRATGWRWLPDSAAWRRIPPRFYAPARRPSAGGFHRLRECCRRAGA